MKATFQLISPFKGTIRVQIFIITLQKRIFNEEVQARLWPRHEGAVERSYEIKRGMDSPWKQTIFYFQCRFHPNIVQLYGIVYYDIAKTFPVGIIMEYMECKSLHYSKCTRFQIKISNEVKQNCWIFCIFKLLVIRC